MSTIEQLARLSLELSSKLNARASCDAYSSETRGLMKSSGDYFRTIPNIDTAQRDRDLAILALNYPPAQLDFTCVSSSTRPFIEFSEKLLTLKALAAELAENFS